MQILNVYNNNQEKIMPVLQTLQQQPSYKHSLKILLSSSPLNKFIEDICAHIRQHNATKNTDFNEGNTAYAIDALLHR